MRLVLASSSAARKMLLQRLMLPFTTVTPNIDETPHKGEVPQHLVERLAVSKARAVAEDFPNALIIGSDQVAVHENDIVGKPGNYAQAVQQLKQASGKRVQLFTGLALLNTSNAHLQSEVAPYTVYFRTLSDATISAYLQREQPFNCAGSVCAEGLGVALIKRFQGDDPNALIGLPLTRLVSMLEKENFPLLLR